MDPFLAQLNRLLISAFKSIMKVEGVMLRDMSGGELSISEMHVLESIGREQPGGIHITDIAQDQGITLPSVTAAVNRLVKKGYVLKERNHNDARRVGVTLTGKGRRAEIAHRYFHRQMVKEVAKGMDDQQREALLLGLEHLNDFLIRSAEQTGSHAGSHEGSHEEMGDERH